MRLSCLASGVLALCFLAACDDDESDLTPPLDSGVQDSGSPQLDAGHDSGPQRKQIELKFAARLTDKGELECGQEYASQGTTGSTVTPKDFRFYVQSVKLRATTGEEVPLVFDDVKSSKFQTPDVALIDFTTTGGECEGGPTESNTTIHGSVPSGYTFNGVKVVVGVPESLNHADPALAPAPLQAPGASWDWLGGYRFLIAEVLPAGAADDDGTPPHSMDAGHHEAPDAGDAGQSGHGSSQPGLGFIHLGSTGCTKNGTQYACSNANRAEFSLTNFDPERDLIMADLGAVFAKADLKGSVQCHGAGAACAPMFESLGVDIASGDPLNLQSVFSVSAAR